MPMTAEPAPLAAAIEYFLGCLDSVRLIHGARPTPCVDWTVHDLLVHLDDSSLAFCQGALGRVVSGEFRAVDISASRPVEWLDPVVLVDRVRRHAQLVRRVWGEVAREPRTVDIATMQVPDALVAGVACIEFAVHGWDLAQAVGAGAALPDDLGAALLPLSRDLVPIGVRSGLFAPPMTAAEAGTAGIELLAFLGRTAIPVR
jgi:uncharacterized protein (TIGR03086 family)